jgi:hypothetical protein|nr:MAG TPA: hypothetical protein [Crassvirales sp.]
MATNLKINSKSEQTTATYTKDDYRVEITYNVNPTTNVIKDINMSIYDNISGNYIGNVNANNNGNDLLTYNISGVLQSKLTDVVNLIEEVSLAIASTVASEQ